MIVNISNHESTVIERGVYYFSLTDYPHISASELRNLLDFIKYEKIYGRQTEIVCGNTAILAAVNNAIAHPETVNITLLTDGCLTEFVYHATDLKGAQQILSGGRLLSATKVYGKSGDELSFEKRDSPWNDPADFFEYIMFCWGNSLVGDYVVMSDSLEGSFNPGVRFYFRYIDLVRHPGHIFDGYHPVKVKDEIILSDYLYACIVPEQYKNDLENLILPELKARVHYLPHDELGINEWSAKVHDFISRL